jgi:hypothetical protein
MQDHLCSLFCFTVAGTAVTKAVTLVFRLRAMQPSAELFKKFYLRLRAMQLGVKFKRKIFLPTPRSALCSIARSHLYFSANSQPYAKMILPINQ